jgi:hypothetical protein
MMEPVEFGEYPFPQISTEDWAVSGAKKTKFKVDRVS